MSTIVSVELVRIQYTEWSTPPFHSWNSHKSAFECWHEQYYNLSVWAPLTPWQPWWRECHGEELEVVLQSKHKQGESRRIDYSGLKDTSACSVLFIRVSCIPFPTSKPQPQLFWRCSQYGNYWSIFVQSSYQFYWWHNNYHHLFYDQSTPGQFPLSRTSTWYEGRSRTARCNLRPGCFKFNCHCTFALNRHSVWCVFLDAYLVMMLHKQNWNRGDATHRSASRLQATVLLFSNSPRSR